MSNSSFSLSSSSSIPKGVCLCGVKAEITTSWTQFNTGRGFFCCKTSKARGGCNYFDWYDDERRLPLPDPLPLLAPLPLSVPLPLPLPLPLSASCTLITAEVSTHIELLKLGYWLKLCGMLELGGWLKLGGLLDLGDWLKLGGLLELGGWLKLDGLLELGGLLELAAWLELPGCPIPS
ncbi:hypothetical protein T459_00893 [Capsicum annuum]|uniref:GRF-type domain-containing protein n=1 Tax=Capsicum annuum TaxID=4072 RepID=A0A2G3AFJ1_CAPAN|nr:hypothetical protein T459_00893 [Capsicum annuum]